MCRCNIEKIYKIERGDIRFSKNGDFITGIDKHYPTNSKHKDNFRPQKIHFINTPS